MIDIRDYKETIKAAVAKERDADENWNWNVKAVTKSTARIGWGYLDYLGEKDAAFVIRVDEMQEFEGVPLCVMGDMPNGLTKYAFIGSKQWDDAATVEEGIALMIHSMASSAHRTY